MPLADDSVRFESAEAIQETDMALLCRIEGEDPIWIPKSVIHDDSEVYSMKSNTGCLVLLKWWAEERGLG